MTLHARIAIVGGGIAGCSLAYQLTARGCAEVVLLEKGELTSGSTWHAAGNVPFYMHGSPLSALHKASWESYAALAARAESGVKLHRSGSLKVATHPAQMAEFEDFAPGARAMGIAFEIVGPGDVERLFPYVCTEGIHGAAHTPEDGHVDPAALTHAFAAAAREAGVRISRQSPVEEISRRRDGSWSLRAGELRVAAEHVVNAAGLHCREVSALVGHPLPAVPMERQYLVTEPVPGIEALARELPVLRDVSAPLYIRQEQRALLLGLYDRSPVFWGVEGTPFGFDQELLPADLERVDFALQGALHRIPVLNEVGVKSVLNGPLMRTPDASPLVGPVAELRGYWLHTGYFAGIAQAGGCASILARWILEGDPGADVSLIDPARFDASIDVRRTMELTRLAYAEELSQGRAPSPS